MVRSIDAAAQDGVAFSELLDDVCALLDRDVRSLVLGRGGSKDRVDTLWDLVASEMRSNVPDARRAELLSLLDRIRETGEAYAQQRAAEGSALLGRLASAMSSVAGADSVEALFAVVPEAACRLGFDRALVSTVDGTWRLHTMHVVRDPGWAEEIVAVGQEASPVLDRTIVENDTVVDARATLVHDVQDNPRVNRALAEITRSASYGIAPLLVDGDVVGLLHGDYYHQRRVLTDDDAHLLTAFAAGVSQNLARLAVLDGLADLRERFDAVSSWSPSPRRAAPAPRVIKDDPVLTRREVQIMEMVAAGDANARIARRLVISEATVKSHMTHILRKLGAANRAEAVSMWLRASARGA
ncbi:LuxR C-terminal-related transcriptional regulator [Tsukamurella sp. NPDC003166]|uniref:LuxR C-terminal-related transcriptional regulator n=1 Tax=Tsukamurella sp. NPDC003166 TaxID=3154444 RepID=UPI00339EBF39